MLGLNYSDSSKSRDVHVDSANTGAASAVRFLAGHETEDCD